MATTTKAKAAKGKYKKESVVIRISPELDKELRTHRRRKESYDNLLRRMLGLEARKYVDRTARAFFAVVDTPQPFICDDAAEARGKAIQQKVKLKQDELPPVIMVREVLA